MRHHYPWLRLVTIALAATLHFHAQAQDIAKRTLTLIVQNENGTPEAGTDVYCLELGTGNEMRFENQREDEHLKSDNSGRCVFEIDPRRQHFLYASTSITSCESWRHFADENAAEITLTLKPCAPFRGIVRDRQGKPVPDVQIWTARFVPIGVTDPNGMFNIPSLTSESRVSLYKPGYAWLELSFIQTNTFAVLEQQTVINVAVQDPSGKPIPGAVIETDLKNMEVVTGEKGTATLLLPVGSKARIHAHTRDYSVSWKDNAQTIQVESLTPMSITLVGEPQPQPGARAPEHARSEITFTNYRPGSSTTTARFAQNTPAQDKPVIISGRAVRAGTDEPVKGAVWAIDHIEAFPGSLEAGTRADGSFAIRDMRGAARFLYFVPFDKTLYVKEGIIAIDRNQFPIEGLIFTVDQGCSVSGVMQEADGKPIAQQWVMLEGTKPFPMQRLTNERGTFLFTNLPPIGKGRLRFAKDFYDLPNMTPGTNVENIVFKRLTETERLFAKGVVVDSKGNPVGGASITLSKGDQGGPGHGYAHTETDGYGRFSAEFENRSPGMVKAQVYMGTFFSIGELESRTGQDCPIIEGGEFDVTKEARVVVDVPEWRFFWGTASDEEGKPLKVEVEFPGVTRSRYVEAHDDGVFAMQHAFPEKGPISVVVSARGYQSVAVAVSDKELIDKTGVHVKLKRGPYIDEENIWLAMTGRPDTPEEVEKFPFGTAIRDSLDRYKMLAAAETEPPKPTPVPQPPAQPTSVSIRVVDTKQSPVTKIRMVRVTERVMSDQPIDLLNAAPASNAANQELQNKDGLYSVPAFTRIDAMGLASAIVTGKEEHADGEPIIVTMPPSASATIAVTDFDNVPVANALLCRLDDYGMVRSQRSGNELKSDASGAISLDALTPGTYSLALTEPKANHGEPQIVSFELRAGDRKSITIRIGEPKPGSIEEKLVRWYKENNAYNQSAYVPVDSELVTSTERKAIAVEVTRQLDSIYVIHPILMRRLLFLAALVDGMKLHEAIPALKRVIVREASPKAGNLMGLHYSVPIQAIAHLEGDTAVDYFVQLASDSTRPARLRSQAIIGLGVIGTDKSVAAYQSLRDAAYAYSGAPAAKKSYTHAERMAEAVIMTMCTIPGSPHGQVVNLESAEIDSDYVTGRITAGNIDYGYPTYTLRRFGDEWLVVSMVAGAIS